MKKFNSIDLLKFVLCFFVIAIHVNTLCKGYGRVGEFVFRTAVPMFFIISGFLLQKKIEINAENSLPQIIKQYLNKLICLYLLWTIVYLPLTIIDYFNNHFSFLKSCALFVRNVLFIGENYMSWPLWYLLALIVAVLIIKYFLKYHINIQMIALVGILFTAAGLYINQLRITIPEGSCFLLDWYFKIFGSTRNGFFIGFGYVSLGMLLAKWEYKLRNYHLLSVFLMISSGVAYWYKVPLALNLFSFFAIFFVLQIKLQNRTYYKWMREMSTLMYFSHMMNIVVILVLIPKISSFWLLFILSSLLTVMTSALLIQLKTYKKLRFLNNLIG